MQALGNVQQVTGWEEDGYSFQASKPALCITKIKSDVSGESSAPPHKSYCSLIVLFGMYSVFQKLGACSSPAWLWNVGQQLEPAWWSMLFHPNPPPLQEKGIKQHYFSPWIFTEIITSHTIIQDYFAQYKITQNGPIVLWKPLVPSLLEDCMADHVGHVPPGKFNSKLFQKYQIDALSFFIQSLFIAITFLKLFHKTLLMT